MKKELIILSGLFLLLLTGVANAALITYNFSGHLTVVERPEGWDAPHTATVYPKISVGDYFFGLFSYETSPDFYEIYGSSLSVTFIHNDQSTTNYGNPRTRGYIQEGNTFDSFEIAQYYTGGSSFYEGGVVFKSTDGSALNSLCIPETIDLVNWDIAHFFMEADPMAGAGMVYYIEGDIQNLQLTPEPTTMILFGIGLLGLAGISRRKKII